MSKLHCGMSCLDLDVRLGQKDFCFPCIPTFKSKQCYKINEKGCSALATNQIGRRLSRGGGEGALPYLTYMGTCYWTGYGF